MRRRSFNARMSLAQNYRRPEHRYETPVRAADRATAAISAGHGPAGTADRLLAAGLQIEAERRISDVNWAATLQGMPPASVNARDRDRTRAQQLSAIPDFQDGAADRNHQRHATGTDRRT